MEDDTVLVLLAAFWTKCCEKLASHREQVLEYIF